MMPLPSRAPEVLALIAEFDGGLTIDEIMQRAGMDRMSAHRYVNRLVSKGHVKRSGSLPGRRSARQPVCKRRRVWSVTAAGRARLQGVKQ